METSTVLLTVIFCILSVLLTVPYGSRHLENAATLGPDAVDCVGDYAYERKAGRNANGATRYNTGNTLSKCKSRCSAVSSCRSFDYNYNNNECWIHSSNVENDLQVVSGVDHYERIDCPASSTAKTTGLPPTVPNCVKNYHYDDFEDTYVIGGVKHTASNTLLKCLNYCSGRALTGSNACTAVDFNDQNECWVHKLPADQLHKQTAEEGTVTHYVRERCGSTASATTGLPPTIPDCIKDYQYVEFEDRYVIGGVKHAASNTLLKCLTYCSGRTLTGTNACTAVDFNDKDECWVHKHAADELIRQAADEGTVTHYVRESCDAKSTTPHTPQTTVPQPNLPVKFELLFTNDFDATIEDMTEFISTIRNELCDDFGIRCARLLRPRTSSDVYKVVEKDNPGPAIGSIVVLGELAEGLEGETTTQKVMEDFDFDDFRPRLSDDNSGIRMKPDTSTNYEGFTWERIYPTDPPEKPEDDDPLGLKTEYWVLIGLAILAVVITVIAIAVICCLRRNSESSDKDLKEKEKQKKRAEQERKKREKEEKKRAEEERRAREKEEKMREKMDKDVEKGEEDAYTEPDVVPTKTEDLPSGLSDDDKAY